MKAELLYRGKVFSVLAIVLGDGSKPAIEFLERLRQGSLSSHKSLVNIIIRHADYGPLLNIKKSRPVKGYDGLFEFKSTQGARLVYFYESGGITVITHGFKKGAPEKREYERARFMRAQWTKEAPNG